MKNQNSDSVKIEVIKGGLGYNSLRNHDGLEFAAFGMVKS
jgi:hypothetical protein